MKLALNNVMRIDYYGRGYEKRIALFNANKITKAEVWHAINNGSSENHTCIIDISRVQFDNVFYEDD